MVRLECGRVPCGSCPYRRDVPSGVWSEEEYRKLPTYDGEPYMQILQGGRAVFMCHQQDGKLCAGWVGCHGGDNLIALRLTQAMLGNEIDPSVWAYESPVPLWDSGAEAAAHGMREIDNPGRVARAMVQKLQRKAKRRQT